MDDEEFIVFDADVELEWELDQAGLEAVFTPEPTVSAYHGAHLAEVDTEIACALHGEAFTYGCPGCEDYADDIACAEEVRRRTRWWKRSQWCPHWWRTLEPAVKRCRICGCTEFADATLEQLRRWLWRR